ncbi:hypothetical protein C1646_740120 [Rhizophagus diaphanus]|nr:hypothetical protein C1646_740120 [Rhizophagus diaphanus] [Rhizophagus sp. MUCL 43196]
MARITINFGQNFDQKRLVSILVVPDGVIPLKSFIRIHILPVNTCSTPPPSPENSSLFNDLPGRSQDFDFLKIEEVSNGLKSKTEAQKNDLKENKKIESGELQSDSEFQENKINHSSSLSTDLKQPKILFILQRPPLQEISESFPWIPAPTPIVKFLE